MFAPRFRHPVAVVLGIFLFLFQSVADAREVGCSHHSVPVEHATDGTTGHTSGHHSQHSVSSGDHTGGSAHSAHDVAASGDHSPAGEQCNCGPLCSGLVAPPPPLPEMWTRERTTWTPVSVPAGTGVEVLPVHRIPFALLDLPPPVSA